METAKLIKILLLVGIALFFGRYVWRFVDLMDILKGPVQHKNDEHCAHVESFSGTNENFPADGFEDLVYVHLADGTLAAVGCAGDLHQLFHKGIDGARSGFCALVESDAGGGVLTTKLPLEGFPEGVAFHPHGMHSTEVLRLSTAVPPAYKALSMIFMINHASTKGGERIDAFTLAVSPEQQHALFYEGTIRHPTFDAKYHFIMNDLVVVADRRLTPSAQHGLYFTVYMDSPEPQQGRNNPKTVRDAVRLQTAKLRLFFDSCHTSVVGCRFSNFGARPVCEVVATGLCMANGIAYVEATPGGSAEGTAFFIVNDVVRHELIVYTQPMFAATKPFDYLGRVPLRHAVDNIEFDRSDAPDGRTARLVPGSTPKVGSFEVGFFAGAIQSLLLGAKNGDLGKQGTSPGGTTWIRIWLNYTLPKFSIGASREDELVMHDGHVFTAVSCGVVLPPAPESHAGPVVVMGSYIQEGLLVCTMPKGESVATASAASSTEGDL